jgi:hypothetical protein
MTATIKTTVETEDLKSKIRSITPRTLLSTLWIFATLNFVYCDVVTLFSYVTVKSTINYNQGFLLGAAVLVEIPISMVLLSRILKYRSNRWANIIAGAVMTIVQAVTLFVGTPAIFYVFFSVIEIATTAFVVWYAWNWHPVSKENALGIAEISPNV